MLLHLLLLCRSLSFRLPLLFSILLLVHLFERAHGQCVVRDDCSYGISIEVARSFTSDVSSDVPPQTPAREQQGHHSNNNDGSDDSSVVWFEGVPVSLLENGKHSELECLGVERNDGATHGSWNLEYGSLTLTIENHALDAKDGGGIACIMSYTTTRDIHIWNDIDSSTTASGSDDLVPVTTFPGFRNGSDSKRHPWQRQQHRGTQSDLLDGRLSWQGSFFRPQHGACSGGLRGGPCVIYEKANPTHGSVLILSPLDQFLTTTQSTEFPSPTTSASPSVDDDDDVVWIASTVGTVKKLPAGYTHKFIAVLGTDGITSTINSWGSYMQDYYQTTRLPDKTLTTLGYQTDNGAQYCFCRENCDQVLIDEITNLKETGVPVSYLSFQNAWWHTSHSAPWCVSDWGWEPKKVPMGVPEFHRQLDNMPLQFYCPYFCNDTSYVVDTNFTFISSNPSIPSCDIFNFKNVSPEQSLNFYRWFLQLGDSLGMKYFEVDFINQNLFCTDRFRQEVGAAEEFFRGMAIAAYELKIPLQWCYAIPLFALESLKYASVTNFRVSEDYFYGRSWDIGVSSLLVWAMGGSPSTDTFWTSDNGNMATVLGGCPKKGCPDDHGDSGCALHTLLAIMSSGPVAFSDARLHTNKDRILQTCRADGVLLRPNKPLTELDRAHGIHAEAGESKLLQTYSGPAKDNVWAYYIVGHHLSQISSKGVTISLDELWPRPTTNNHRWFITLDRNACIDDGAPSRPCGRYVSADSASVVLPKKTGNDFEYALVTVARVCQNSNWVLLGEMAKHVSLSTDRFHDLECLESGVLFKVSGQPGEEVTITAANAGLVHVHTQIIDDSGAATLRFSSVDDKLVVLSS